MGEREIGIIKQMLENGDITQEVAEKYCPELAENKGEKVRKDILKILANTDLSSVDSTFYDMVTYLENTNNPFKGFRGLLIELIARIDNVHLAKNGHYKDLNYGIESYIKYVKRHLVKEQLKK